MKMDFFSLDHKQKNQRFVQWRETKGKRLMRTRDRFMSMTFNLMMQRGIIMDSICMWLMIPVILLFLVTMSMLYLLVRLYRSLRIKDCDNRYVLITGCDTGFGNRTARKLDAMGVHVFATCLTEEKVKELTSICSTHLMAIEMNVCDEKSILKARSLVEKALPKGKGLWALLNNAGIVGPVGLCDWLGKAEFETTINVNVLGMAMVTKTFLPLIRQSQGRVINMSSVVGRIACTSGPYTVSKFCVEAFSDTLRKEGKSMGISVHTIEPGGYNTAITDAGLTVSSMKKTFSNLSHEVKEYYGGEDYLSKLSSRIAASCYILATRNLDEVVDTYIDAVTAHFPKTRYIVGLNGNFIFHPLWLMPTWLVDFLFGMAFPKPKKLLEKRT